MPKNSFSLFCFPVFFFFFFQVQLTPTGVLAGQVYFMHNQAGFRNRPLPVQDPPGRRAAQGWKRGLKQPVTTAYSQHWGVVGTPNRLPSAQKLWSREVGQVVLDKRPPVRIRTRMTLRPRRRTTRDPCFDHWSSKDTNHCVISWADHTQSPLLGIVPFFPVFFPRFCLTIWSPQDGYKEMRLAYREVYLKACLT